MDENSCFNGLNPSLTVKNGRSDDTWNGAFLVLRELMGGAFSDSGWSALWRDAAGSQCWADVT